jgi:hypothetical protein
MYDFKFANASQLHTLMITVNTIHLLLPLNASWSLDTRLRIRTHRLHQKERRGKTGGWVASAHVEAPEVLQIHHVGVVDEEIHLQW